MADALSARAITGTPRQVAEKVRRHLLDVGVDGVIINLPTHRYTPGVITEGTRRG
jgi:alkanesulfonate monooxygenase SsuD/methylene tetrahydromethanopterin reductase-like flavin-dependent oxidoreductase (luciferase family)